MRSAEKHSSANGVIGFISILAYGAIASVAEDTIGIEGNFFN